jgi:hypothetical protein
MAKFSDKISNLIEGQAPDFTLSDHPKFLEFIKTYFTFMEAAELTVQNVTATDGILLETETALQNNLLLNSSGITSERTAVDEGGKILLEDSEFQSFVNGETITGQTSKATSVIIADDLSNNRLFISAQNKFITGETVVGSTSGAQAQVVRYRANPVENIQQLLDYRDPDKAIFDFLKNFRNEFLSTIPENLASGVNKRNLIKNIQSLYKTKGTNVGHALFFRLLFNETSETIYPRENMLRVSDGKWNTQKILRAITTGLGDTYDLIGRTITQQNDVTNPSINLATAVVENVFKFQIGENEVSEFILNDDTIVGNFVVGETISGTQSDDDDQLIRAVITGIPSIVSIQNSGSLYSENDTITIGNTGGTGAIIQVNNVGRGSITNLFIDDVGSGYSIGDDLVFNNSGTGGGGAVAKISVVNGGITLEESTSTTEDHIILEDETVRGDPYTGNKIVQESGTGSGDITDIRIINSGSGYLTLPTITVSSEGDLEGTGAKIYAYGSDIGRILDNKIVESGAQYERSPSPPDLNLPQNLLVIDRTSSFIQGETISGFSSDGSTVVTGTLSSFNNDLNIFRVSNATGTFGTNTTITGQTSLTIATVVINDQGSATVAIESTAETFGIYLNQDGHVSESTMRIQDSLYYQDFSYVLKVGRTINDWRDSFKKTIHTAGFYFQGQVNIQNTLNLRIKTPVEGITSGTEITPLFRVITTLFSTIFGRRLGTVDDGTSLNPNPQLGVDPDFGPAPSFSSTTRELTLQRSLNYKLIVKQRSRVRGNRTRFGSPVSGTLYNLDKRLLAEGFSKVISLDRINELTLTGLQNVDLDGEQIEMGDFNFKTKTQFAIPTEIGVISGNSFDETGTTFDSQTTTFDKTI